MEILGVGPSELIFIVIIALIILGPKDMQKAGKTIGKWLRDIVTSDGWKIFQQTSHELRTLPNKLMREANEELNQLNKEVNNASSPTVSKYAPPPGAQPSAPKVVFPGNQIAPPPQNDSKPEEGDQEKNA
jgi:Sec-independent protein translocase protein TatA